MSAVYKILIVDDEADLAEMIAYQFKHKGFDVQIARNGLHALQIVHEFKPNLIILDINMPRMGGIEFYSRICDTKNIPMYPVLVLTARANMKELFADLYIDGFMVKPFDIEELIRKAELIIKKRNRMIKRTPSGDVLALRKICIIENDPESMKEIAGVFLNDDYTVIPAKNGGEAMERMESEAPDVALVQLCLGDIAGDILILKLCQMSATMDVKYVLYMRRGHDHHHQVMQRLSTKTGVIDLVEYDKPAELLGLVEKLL